MCFAGASYVKYRPCVDGTQQRSSHPIRTFKADIPLRFILHGSGCCTVYTACDIQAMHVLLSTKRWNTCSIIYIKMEHIIDFMWDASANQLTLLRHVGEETEPVHNGHDSIMVMSSVQSSATSVLLQDAQGQYPTMY
jgi:hypothetical protein